MHNLGQLSRRLSIRYRFTLYLLMGLIPIIIVSIYFAVQVYKAQVTQAFLGHLTAASATAGTVTEFTTGVVRAQGVVALTVSRQRMSPAEMEAYFKAARSEVPVLRTLAYALPSGKVIAAYPVEAVGINVGDRNYFKRVMSGAEWSVSSLLRIRPRNESDIVIARRVVANGKTVGAILSAIDPDSLHRFVSPSMTPGLDYSIIDENANIIVSTVESGVALRNKRSRSYVPGVRSALKGEPSFITPFRDRFDGIEKIGASVPVPELRWVVNIYQPVSTGLGPLRRRAEINIGLILLIVLATVASIWITAGKLAVPIKVLARKARRVAQGDFSQRMSSPDEAELGTLAGAFNNMTDELQRFRSEEERAREYQSLLADVGNILVSTLNPREIFQGVADRTLRYVGSAIFVFRLEPSGILTVVGSAAQDAEVLQTIQGRLAERPLSVDYGVGALIARSKAIFAHELSALRDPDLIYCMNGLQTESSITVQIRVRGEMLGVFSILSASGQLSEDQIPMAQEIAGRLGSALDNARLYEESLEREEFQRGLARLAIAAGSTLEPGEVLGTICSQTLDLLQADGVYIWVLHEEGDKLQGTSGCGFRSREFVGSTLPLSAAEHPIIRAFTDKESFYLHNLSSCASQIAVPEWECSMEAAVYQPLVSGGQSLGVMLIADVHDPERFDEQTLDQAGLLAQYAAAALVNARAYARERKIAETLQRSLLADLPDKVDSFELAHFYTPARLEAMIGGDFYDFISISETSYEFVIGDVSGKGLQAAVVTALAKYVIRAYAAEDPSPALVLSRANDAVFKYTSSEMFVTLVACLLDSKTRTIRYASAGHEPILIYRAGERTIEYQGSTGVASGVLPEAEYLIRSFSLQPGDMLVMYTDGLTDARSPGGEFLGQDGLAALTMELAGSSSQAFLDALMERVKAFTGGEFQDDLAVLVIRAVP